MITFAYVFCVSLVRLMSTIFSCFVVELYQGRMATLSDETCFGDLFRRFAPFLKMYVEYCTQHENTASRVSLIAAKNDKFSNLLHVSVSSQSKGVLGSVFPTIGCFEIPSLNHPHNRVDY